jgi:hypothetical protein
MHTEITLISESEQGGLMGKIIKTIIVIAVLAILFMIFSPFAPSNGISTTINNWWAEIKMKY